MSVVGYSPFGSGNFPEQDSPRGRELGEVAASCGASARQVALAFLIRRESVVVIPKASSLAHVEENAGASDVVLDDEALARLDHIFPRGRGKHLPML